MWHYYFSSSLRQHVDNAVDSEGAKLSLRKFAQRVETSPSVLSEILRNRRQLSAERSMEIAEKAGFTKKELDKLRSLMNSKDQEWSERDQLSTSALSLITNPLYYRIICALEILESPIMRKDLEEFLSASREAVSSALETLEVLDIVTQKANEIKWSGRHVTTTNDVPHASIRAFHKATLNGAISDLAISPAEREYTTVVFAGNTSELQNAKGEIRHFRDVLSKKMRSNNPDCIYQLSIQLRPVSKKFGKKGP